MSFREIHVRSVARILWYSRFLFQKRLCVITLDVCIVFILSGFNSYGEGMFLWQLGKLLCKKWVFAVNIAYLRRKQKQIKRGHPESSSVWKRLEKVLIVVWRLCLREGGDQKETRRLSAGKQICDRVLKFEHERRREKDLWFLKSCVICWVLRGQRKLSWNRRMDLTVIWANRISKKKVGDLEQLRLFCAELKELFKVIRE